MPAKTPLPPSAKHASISAPPPARAPNARPRGDPGFGKQVASALIITHICATPPKCPLSIAPSGRESCRGGRTWKKVIVNGCGNVSRGNAILFISVVETDITIWRQVQHPQFWGESLLCCGLERPDRGRPPEQS